MVFKKAVPGKNAGSVAAKIVALQGKGAIDSECQKSLLVFMNLLMMGVFDTGFGMELRVMKAKTLLLRCFLCRIKIKEDILQMDFV